MRASQKSRLMAQLRPALVFSGLLVGPGSLLVQYLGNGLSTVVGIVAPNRSKNSLAESVDTSRRHKNSTRSSHRQAVSGVPRRTCNHNRTDKHSSASVPLPCARTRGTSESSMVQFRWLAALVRTLIREWLHRVNSRHFNADRMTGCFRVLGRRPVT